MRARDQLLTQLHNVFFSARVSQTAFLFCIRRFGLCVCMCVFFFFSKLDSKIGLGKCFVLASVFGVIPRHILIGWFDDVGRGSSCTVTNLQTATLRPVLL